MNNPSGWQAFAARNKLTYKSENLFLGGDEHIYGYYGRYWVTLASVSRSRYSRDTTRIYTRLALSADKRTLAALQEKKRRQFQNYY